MNLGIPSKETTSWTVSLGVIPCLIPRDRTRRSWSWTLLAPQILLDADSRKPPAGCLKGVVPFQLTQTHPSFPA